MKTHMRREAIEYGVPVIQTRRYNISNLSPSLFSTLSRDETFFKLLKLSFIFRDMFRKRNGSTGLATLTVTCASVPQTRLLTYSEKMLASVLHQIELPQTSIL